MCMFKGFFLFKRCRIFFENDTLNLLKLISTIKFHMIQKCHIDACSFDIITTLVIIKFNIITVFEFNYITSDLMFYYL